MSHTNDLSSAPAAFHNSNNNTVYLLKGYSPRSKQIHNFIHELLHEYSNNYKNYGKCGLNVYGYDENNKLISVGGVINEAATEFLTSIINNDGFIGYNDDMKYIFEIFIDIINIRKDFVSMYFQKENWISDEMNKKFNSSKPYQLDEFIVELDNRLPMYRKKPYDFNKVFAILIDAVFDKLKNNMMIDYQSILNNLYILAKCDFDLKNDNIAKLKNLEEILDYKYGIHYVIKDEKINKEEGKISISF